MKNMDRREALVAFAGTAAALAAATPAHADHKTREAKTQSPLDQMHLYLCAFHLAKKDPKLVFEAHHYCMPVDDEVHQCIIFDGNGKTARILGVEYIVSDKLYRQLPAAEKKYWHPHAYEVTSGLLIAPGMDIEQETELLEGLVNTWGKTWHTWRDPTTPLPTGEPLLMWSASKDGQVSGKALSARDRKFKVSTAELRKRRRHIGPVPQIDFPKSLDSLGRQWTNEGPDMAESR